MAAQSDWWWNFRPTGYNALAWSGSEGNAAQRFLLCSVVLKPTHTQLSPGKFLYYLWEIISESITDADEEASFRYGSDTDRMVGMSNPAVWIIHSDQPHSPNHVIWSPHLLSSFDQVISNTMWCDVIMPPIYPVIAEWFFRLLIDYEQCKTLLLIAI